MKLLLDSNFLIAVLKKVPAPVELFRRLSLEEHTLAYCSIVLSEVHAGTRDEDREFVRGFFSRLEFIAGTSMTGEIAGTFRYQFSRRGIALSTSDCLIAATAVENDCLLLTSNTKDFPMKGLRLYSEKNQV